MVDNLEALAQMEYPGRVIIMAKTTERDNMVIYGLSGRSDPSKARRLKVTNDLRTVYIEVTDQKQLEKGDPVLLVYDAITRDNDSNPKMRTTIVSNGAQTKYIKDSIFVSEFNQDPYYVPVQIALPRAFASSHKIETKDGRKIDLASYEPDEPIFTPRISGIMQGDFMMLNIIKRDVNGEPTKEYFQFRLEPGQGKMIATYDGPNPPKPTPVPFFTGSPRDLYFAKTKPQEIADIVYKALGDFAVSTAVMFPEKGYVARKNLHEGGK